MHDFHLGGQQLEQELVLNIKKTEPVESTCSISFPMAPLSRFFQCQQVCRAEFFLAITYLLSQKNHGPSLRRSQV